MFPSYDRTSKKTDRKYTYRRNHTPTREINFVQILLITFVYFNPKTCTHMYSIILYCLNYMREAEMPGGLDFTFKIIKIKCLDYLSIAIKSRRK